MTSKSHNLLTHDDIYKLYPSKQLSQPTPSTYQYPLILTLAVLTPMIPSLLDQLNIFQFTGMTNGGTLV